ncbi:MAG: tetratricopeptide repeat protein, partial [Anaerolineaceae bacterium]|nr:tetratricopeptide repeat protein [Anaerolineaceae bacterium]
MRQTLAGKYVRHVLAVNDNGSGIPRKPRDNELDVYGVTHLGRVRSENQDHFLIASLHKHLAIHQTSIPPQSISASDTERLAFLAMVADGVGGSAGGEEASRFALDGITAYVTRSMHCYYTADPNDDSEFVHVLQEGAMRVHAKLTPRSTAGDRAGMAWTQNSLGLLYNHLGDAKTALAYHREALRSSKERGARTVQGIAHLGIGQDLVELGNWEAAREAFEAAIAIQDELGQGLRAVEAKSGLAHTLLALMQGREALVLIDEVLDYLATNTLQGARQPFLVYLDCYRVLVANGDPRAPWVLREAYLLLQQQADKIEDDAWRDSFLQNIQANQALVEEYRVL